jgi:predicted secreted protein
MGKVRGEDVILYIQDVTDKCNHMIGCARSVTFDIQQDLVETSITGNGRFRTYVPGAASWSGSVEGIVSIVNTNSITISGELSRYYVPALPSAVSGFIINIPDLCMKIGGTLIVSGTDNADGTYTVLNYLNWAGNTATLITTVELVPSFTTVDPASITYQELVYGIDNMYDAIINGTSIIIEFYETDNEGHFLKKQGAAYFESINEVASFDNMATFTANFKGNGLVDITYG